MPAWAGSVPEGKTRSRRKAGCEGGCPLGPQARVGCPQHAAPARLTQRQSAKGRAPTGAKPRWAGLSSLR